MSGLDNEQRRIIDAMFERRLKPARHEVSDHLDRTLPAIKIKPGVDQDVLITNGSDSSWQSFESTLDTYFATKFDALFSSRFDSNYNPIEVGKIFDWGGPAASIPARHVACFGQALLRTTYPDLFAALCPILSSSATATASNDRITLAGHGLVVGDSVFIESITSGGAGLSTNTQYYVATVVDTNNFTLGTGRTVAAATGAVTVTGGPVNITSDGTGVKVRLAPWGIAASTTFNVPDLREVTTVGLPTMGGTERTTHSFAWANVLGLQAGESTHLLTGAESGTSSHQHSAVNSGLFASRRATTGGGSSLATGTQIWDLSAQTVASTEANASSAHNNVQPGALVNKIIYTGVV